ncbi:hypothetical protein SDC9_157651 [bioreactor metagenome]|uniref:Uncharacterized protein n=1 Tax=bioreactor metagenome TaxID=1076179 RepID=A0A645F9Q7_9ZZZZ
MVYICYPVGKTDDPAFQRLRLNASGMPQDTVPDLISQVESFSSLQDIHDPEALLIMLKPAGMYFIQNLLSGMSKGRMPQIMPQRNGLRKVFVEPQPPGNGTGNLVDLQRVGKPRTVMVPHRGKENLRLMFKPAKGFAVNDPVPISHEGRAHRALLQGIFPSLAF